MALIVLAACFSVWVSIYLKWCKAKNIDLLQSIAWNYVAASLWCAWWFKPDFAHLSWSATPWWVIISLAVVLPSIFWCLGQALNHAGVVKTEIAQRLSVVLSLLAAYVLFQEQFNHLKFLGIALGLAAVICVLLAQLKTGQTKPQQQNARLATRDLLLVWVGYATVDILLKYCSSLGLQFSLSLNLSFILAFIFVSIFVLYRRRRWQTQAIWAGLALGSFNFANIALYVKAHQLLKDSPAIVFASMNIFVVVLGLLAGVLIFKEKLHKLSVAALLFAIAALLCLAKAITQ
ncbi:EamA family transporter [Acinetobacter larvae]|uniref:EamA family transporter n=1 Tax=Acinetobacter larvae TaxID=1789224 RepID=A0A1B2LYK1_9GAMM|nr:EamA family transporter [Acinetobacter larvae]AOA58020.1 EamA family transporter [Acinetobacter larvae]